VGEQKEEFMFKFFVSAILMTATIAGIYALEGGDLMNFISFSTFMIVAFVPFFASLAVWKFQDLLQVWKDAFAKTKNSSSMRLSCKILDFYEKLFYLSGLICLLVGVIFVLSRLSDISKLGSGLAYTLSGLLYGLYFGVIARILKSRIENKME
jgi:flagellar motor component MotA